MLWKLVHVTKIDAANGKLAQFQEEFWSVFAAEGGPEGAGMFSRASGDNYEVFFTPKASEIFAEALVGRGAIDSVSPNRTGLSKLVGHDEVWTLIDGR